MKRRKTNCRTWHGNVFVFSSSHRMVTLPMLLLLLLLLLVLLPMLTSMWVVDIEAFDVGKFVPTPTFGRSWRESATKTTTIIVLARAVASGENVPDESDSYDSLTLTESSINASTETGISKAHLQHDRLWEERYQEMVEYANNNNGATNPPLGTRLGNWANHQRRQNNKKQLSDYRTKKLNKINFKWSIPRMQHRKIPWDVMYDRLSKFKEKNGHVNVPRYYLEDLKLGQWVYQQRRLHNLGKAKPERIAKLEEIDFNWKVISNEEKWENGFQKMYQFYMKHNHTLVPFQYDEDPDLGRWVQKQRVSYKTSDLSLHQIYKLEQIGFVWDVNEALWKKMYQKLVAYQEEHGQASVPQHCREDPSLGVWVSTQRTVYKKGKMEQDKINLLKAIGFEWDAHEAAWIEEYKKIVAFWEEHGHCKVARHYKKDPKLGTWVFWQRRSHKKGRLKKSRKDLLDKIGFFG